MAEKRRLFDVWIVETNTVYRQVPYSVVTDWAQEGRLLADDRLRASGSEAWTPAGELPALAAFLPRAEPHRPQDEAEALEPVQVEFSWRPHTSAEDDDVDMIPLIDISLVLLIFFMMTASVSTASSLFNTPQAEYMLVTINPEMFWIGIHYQDGQARYSLGKGDGGDGQTYNQDEVVQALAERLQQEKGQVDVRIRADRSLPADVVVQDLTPKLEKFRRQGKVRRVFIEVSEKERR